MKTYIQPNIKVRELSNEETILAASSGTPTVTGNTGIDVAGEGETPAPGGFHAKRYNIWDTEDFAANDDSFE